ncbi:phage major capsid protein [Chthonobacter albigriseus]|uniref:phage major capsid protein n=1 Tax=Chthonobacter albigriseus TaxID=1683161 RepID=UPI0015EED53B|nr:phage major capsid protein [Chthonobacter albigriseus]
MTIKSDAVPETKGTSDTGRALGELMTAFESFKETNDERLAALERRSADVLTEEKLGRINDAIDRQQNRLDRLTLKAGRPQLDGRRAGFDALDLEHRTAFDTYVRTGVEGNLRALEAKAMSAGSGVDGGFVVTPVIEDEIGRRLAAISPIRSIASVRPVSVGTFKKPYRTTGPAVGWVGETAARPQTNSPVLAELSFPTMELYAMPSATQMLLDDAAVDIDQWLVEEIELAFATQEGQAFVSGDGVSRPRGFLQVPTVAEASWVWGSLGYLVTGVSGNWAASNPSDVLVDLVYALKAGYRQNGSWVMNRKLQAAVRKFKDSAGNYLWQPPATADTRATLMGFPLVEAEDMPDVAANSLSIAFGDFRRGYLIVDRLGTRVLRDPYSAKPYVLFYTTKRVGGGVQDFDAIKLLKFGTA